MTSVISPFGGSAKVAATAGAVPRTTSSKRFVSSRQTATRRSGSAAARLRSDAGSRLGDSKPTAGCGQRASSSHKRIPLRLAAREIAEEAVLIVREPRRDERRLDGRGPGSTVTAIPRSSAADDEAPARIVDARQPGIGDQRDALARREPRQQLVRSRRLVVLVVAQQPSAPPIS